MIKRGLFGAIKNHLSQKEITFIIGPRQAGKTTLMLALQDYLRKKSKKTVFLNLDIEADKIYFVSQSALIKKLNLELGKSDGYVFIDEIQRKENAGVFLKGIYDLGLPYKFIVSGSGSVELKEKIHESLIGRKRVFLLNPLTFEEFVNFKTNYQYQNRLLEFFQVEKVKREELLSEYLNFGGYPKVVLAQTLDEKERMIDEIYQSYLEKDAFYLLGVKKTEAFVNLVKIIASQIGNLVNFQEVSRTLGISVKTVKQYLWYLEKTFILEKVTPYFRNVRKEITKSPTFYFLDLGLRNYALGIFGRLDQLPSGGFLFENFVFQILRLLTAVSPTKIHFWRSKDGAAVDFILDFSQTPLPIEVKFSHLKKIEMTKSLTSFLKKYQPKKGLLVNLSYRGKSHLRKTDVYALPYYQLINYQFL